MKLIFLAAIFLSLQISTFAGIDTGIPATNQIILSVGAWKPSTEQTQKALVSVQAFLNQSKHHDIPKILANTKNYRVQFVGVLRNGKKVIWCNFFPAPDKDDEFHYWKRDKVEVMDGGFSFWQIDFDPTKNSCSEFKVNGYA